MLNVALVRQPETWAAAPLRTGQPKRASLVWTAGIALACASACGSPPPSSQPSPLLGDVTPTFESTTLNGNPVYSTAFHGNPFVVTFVRSDCAPCERTLSAAQAAYADLRDVVVVGVFDAQGSDDASRVTRKLALKFPVIIDHDGRIARQFKIEQVPRTFVMDGNGRVRWVGGANLDEDTLESAVRSVD